MSLFVIEMPVDWNSDMCDDCNPSHYQPICGAKHCPLAAARPVVKVKDCQGLEMYAAKKDTEDKGKLHVH